MIIETVGIVSACALILSLVAFVCFKTAQITTKIIERRKKK